MTPKGHILEAIHQEQLIYKYYISWGFMDNNFKQLHITYSDQSSLSVYSCPGNRDKHLRTVNSLH